MIGSRKSRLLRLIRQYSCGNTIRVFSLNVLNSTFLKMYLLLGLNWVEHPCEYCYYGNDNPFLLQLELQFRCSTETLAWSSFYICILSFLYLYSFGFLSHPYWTDDCNSYMSINLICVYTGRIVKIISKIKHSNPVKFGLNRMRVQVQIGSHRRYLICTHRTTCTAHAPGSHTRSENLHVASSVAYSQNSTHSMAVNFKIKVTHRRLHV